MDHHQEIERGVKKRSMNNKTNSINNMKDNDFCVNQCGFLFVGGIVNTC